MLCNTLNKVYKALLLRLTYKYSYFFLSIFVLRILFLVLFFFFLIDCLHSTLEIMPKATEARVVLIIIIKLHNANEKYFVESRIIWHVFHCF